VGDEESQAFSQVLVLANYSSTRAFQRAARHDLSYANLYQESAKYRGEVVHLTGRLLRLIRFDPPLEAAGQGVSSYYEAWIFSDGYGNNPYCAICVELPPGLKPAPKIEGVEVACDGYFYKRFRYKAADSYRPEQYRDAPVVIGHGLTILARSEPQGPQTWGHGVMVVFVAGVSLSVLFVIALTVWFRYSDHRVRRRLQMAREANLVLPEPDDNGPG
jgi:cbb3-type cytochrome oxidase subunit 3